MVFSPIPELHRGDWAFSRANEGEASPGSGESREWQVQKVGQGQCGCNSRVCGLAGLQATIQPSPRHWEIEALFFLMMTFKEMASRSLRQTRLSCRRYKTPHGQRKGS